MHQTIILLLTGVHEAEVESSGITLSISGPFVNYDNSASVCILLVVIIMQPHFDDEGTGRLGEAILLSRGG